MFAVIGVLVWRISSSGRIRLRFGARHDHAENNADDTQHDARGERRLRLEQGEARTLRSLSDEERLVDGEVTIEADETAAVSRQGRAAGARGRAGGLSRSAQ